MSHNFGSYHHKLCIQNLSKTIFCVPTNSAWRLFYFSADYSYSVYPEFTLNVLSLGISSEKQLSRLLDSFKALCTSSGARCNLSFRLTSLSKVDYDEKSTDQALPPVVSYFPCTHEQAN